MEGALRRLFLGDTIDRCNVLCLIPTSLVHLPVYHQPGSQPSCVRALPGTMGDLGPAVRVRK